MFKPILVTTLFINFFCLLNLFADEEDGLGDIPDIVILDSTSSHLITKKNMCGCSAAIVASFTGAIVVVSIVVGGVVLAFRCFDVTNLSQNNALDWSEIFSGLDLNFSEFNDWINDTFSYLF